MSIHLKIWIGGPSARIVDMDNAGRRGKTCQAVTLSGWMQREADVSFIRFDLPHMLGLTEEQEREAERGGALLPALGWAPVEAALMRARELCPEVGITPRAIRGIDAPRPTLAAGTDRFAATVGDRGVWIRDLTDAANEPTAITHNQSEARAYDLARKVWPRVEAAASFSEAWRILSDAGCHLHHFCAVD